MGKTTVSEVRDQIVFGYDKTIESLEALKQSISDNGVTDQTLLELSFIIDFVKVDKELFEDGIARIEKEYV